MAERYLKRRMHAIAAAFEVLDGSQKTLTVPHRPTLERGRNASPETHNGAHAGRRRNRKATNHLQDAAQQVAGAGFEPATFGL